MATQNSITRAISKLQFWKEKADSVLPWSKASEDSTEIAYSDTTYFQKADGKKELEILYRNNWAVFKAINVRANLLATRGLKIICKSDKAKNVVKNFLKDLHPTRPMLALQNSFRNRSINADIFGNAFEELLYIPAGTRENPADPKKARDLLGFTPIHPINIDFLRKPNSNKIEFKNGKPKGWKYTQDPLQDYQAIKLPLERIAHLRYNVIGDELLGMSTIEPVFKTAERLLKIEEGITQGILTHGNPLHDVIVGDEAHPPTKKMIDNIAEEVKGLNMKSEYVHPPWIRVGQIEAFSLGKSPNYMQPFITAIAACTGVPEFILLGRGEGTNKATATAMVNFVHQTIEPLQQTQALFFEEQILSPLMKLKKIDEVPTIEWNEILPKSVSDYANVIKVLSEAMIGGKQIITFEEARELAGLGKSSDFKKPSESQLTKKAQPGIYLPEPHSKLIYNGRKKIIMKAKRYSKMEMKPLIWFSDSKAYGFLKLRSPKVVSLDEFHDLAEKHLVTEKERKKWWPDIKRFYSYEFNILDKFKEPKPFKPPKGTQTFLKDVKL